MQKIDFWGGVKKTTLKFSVKNPEGMPHPLSLRFHSLMWAHIHEQSPLTCWSSADSASAGTWSSWCSGPHRGSDSAKTFAWRPGDPAAPACKKWCKRGKRLALSSPKKRKCNRVAYYFPALSFPIYTVSVKHVSSCWKLGTRQSETGIISVGKVKQINP